jgi:hypothetical protein
LVWYPKADRHKIGQVCGVFPPSRLPIAENENLKQRQFCPCRSSEHNDFFEYG